jgi:hypothetical protein
MNPNYLATAGREITTKKTLFFWGALIVIAGGFGAFLSSGIIKNEQWNKEERLCDQAVNTLLTTKDLVDLERAMFLVRWYNCGISRRL